MANELSSISQARVALLNGALEQANQKLKAHDLELRSDGQWPPKPGDRADHFDERPDVDISMRADGKWVPIDIVYLRQMPIEPEKLKSVAALAEDLFEKALGHFKAIGNRHILISEAGSKYESHLKKHTFHFDDEGYIRIDNMRVVHKKPESEFYSPIKASNIRSHSIQKIVELGDDIVNITDDFDLIRTDGRKGMFCLIGKAQSVALDQFPPSRRDEAAKYDGPYIPLVRELPKQ